MYTSDGGLMSYGPDLSAIYEMAAKNYLKPILDSIAHGTFHANQIQATWPILSVSDLPPKFKVRVPWSNAGADLPITPSIIP
jgi:hypothetical protein